MPSASKDVETILWRRVDRPGHEAARLLAHGSTWHLGGTAVFSQEGNACSLEYLIQCDAAWQTISARVSGWVGARVVELNVVADAARRWQLNGSECHPVAGCVDIDLAFSPSTNLLPIRRLNLRLGQGAEIRAAWLRFPELILEPLDQVYRRLDLTTYRYESGGGGGGGAFTALLRTNAAGFVTSYPGRWESVEDPIWVRFTWRLRDLDLNAPATAGYRFRAARPDELDTVIRVVLSAYASDPAWESLLGGIKERMSKRIGETLGAPDSHYVAAVFKGGIVAVSGIARTHWTDQNLLTGICVTPEHQRKGLGTYLLAASLLQLRELGLESARVYTEAGSLADRKIYPLFGSTREEGVDYPGLKPA